MMKNNKTQKVCNYCNICKPLEDFKAGRCTCIICYREIYRQKYHDNIEVERQKRKESRLRKKLSKNNNSN